MLQKELPIYQNLPIIPPQNALHNKPNIMYYNQLIINTQNFRHPGTQTILTTYFSKDISDIFPKRQHSFNAKLMLINLTIGRTSQKQGKGYQLFEQVKKQKISILHQKIMKDINLSNGVLKQVSKFSKQQIQAFVSIPKYYSNPSSIMFKQTKLQQFLYLDRFWVSNTIFTAVVVSIIAYLYTHNALFNNTYRVMLFLLGLLTWTIIQYYFHRIVLHVPIQTGKILNPHYIHHAFPNLPNKLALSIIRNLFIQFCAFMIMTKSGLLQYFDALHFMLGLQLLLTLYDVLHYYFHFGPELNIPIISYLKKNHMKHHYRDSNRGFGVTTVFWDWVFGTMHVK